MSDIEYEDLTEPCFMCGNPRTVRIYTKYPTKVAPPRSQAEQDAAKRETKHQHDQTEKIKGSNF